MSDTASDRPANGNGAARRRGLVLLGIAVLTGGLLWGGYWFAWARHVESTDDAYVAGDIVAITSREPATVRAVHADDTQAVTRGQLLVEFDPARARVKLQAAEAELARAVRAVRADFSRVHEHDSQVAAARVGLAQAEADRNRRREGAGDGSVSAEEAAHARAAVESARAALRAAENAQAQAIAAVDNTTVASNPGVMAAIAQVRDAVITLSHMRLTAPVSGVVARRTVQVGQRVAAGTPLLAVVPLDQLWVDANFKEGQLQALRVDQPVELTADVYGSSVTYHGRVAGVGAGSGAAFALLPPQNASGNWIKIVQRVPVRIALDPEELRQHPLRIGLSMTAEVDIRDRSGAMVTDKPLGTGARSDTADTDAEADHIVARILAENGATM